MSENKNWFEEGRQAALKDLHHVVFGEFDADDDYQECPWPIHTPEGGAWIQGWNSVAMDNREELLLRPNHSPSLAFMPQEA